MEVFKNVNNKKCAPKMIFFNKSQKFAIFDDFYSTDHKT